LASPSYSDNFSCERKGIDSVWKLFRHIAHDDIRENTEGIRKRRFDCDPPLIYLKTTCTSLARAVSKESSLHNCAANAHEAINLDRVAI
jgi:hypothetical protein